MERVYTMFVVGETQCGKDIVVTIFQFLCILIKTYFSSRPFILVSYNVQKQRKYQLFHCQNVFCLF